MTRDEIEKAIIHIFGNQFEIENPGMDDDLREVHEFDSIDAIELLREIEILLGTQLTREEKKAAMDIRTITHIVDYVTELDRKTERPKDRIMN
ncbi:MAG: acyl carrier protein [Desulfosarcina sp.]|nr:acyl carrier protein [Desulfosarcina sp.]MBC2743025.1 acyl carrier protein [Desulfosarcina sp.]MBC2765935.1 acyl carrier protein [Desulfosarcina sp.]